MRILLLADIHGNWPALQAVAALPHDLCLCLGDLVDYGPDPSPCIDWVRKNAAHCVRGNHDHGAAQRVHINGRSGFKYLSGVSRVLTWEKLNATNLRWPHQTINLSPCLSPPMMTKMRNLGHCEVGGSSDRGIASRASMRPAGP